MFNLLEQSYTMLYPAVQNDDEAFIWVTNIPHPLFNVVLRTQSLDKLPLEIPHTVVAMKDDIKFVEALKAKNYKYLLTTTFMSWDVKPLHRGKHSVDVADIGLFGTIMGKAFQVDETIIDQLILILQQSKAENYIVFHEEEPVGTGTLVSSGKIGGIFDIATLSEFQRKGCGEAMMRHLMNRAVELGLEKVVLLSTPAGFKLYSNLGFKAEMELDFYM